MAGQWTPKSTFAAEAKDKSYEFGITLGAARGNMPSSFADLEETEKMDMLYKEFDFMLKAKSHPNFTRRFEKYWADKQEAKKPGANAPAGVRILPSN